MILKRNLKLELQRESTVLKCIKHSFVRLLTYISHRCAVLPGTLSPGYKYLRVYILLINTQSNSVGTHKRPLLSYTTFLNWLRTACSTSSILPPTLHPHSKSVRTGSFMKYRAIGWPRNSTSRNPIIHSITVNARMTYIWFFVTTLFQITEE